MDLVVRPVRVEELGYCSLFIRDRFAYSDTELADLVRLWKWLIGTEAVIAEVMDDRDAALGEHLAYFAFTVFLTDEFARLVQAANSEVVSKLVTAQWMRGGHPVMTQSQVRDANSPGGAGVTLLCLSSGGPCMHPLRMDEHTKEILHEVAPWLLRSYSGYRLKEVLLETFGPEQFEWAANMGLDVQVNSLGSPTPNQSANGSCLFGMSRNEAAKAGVGHGLSRIFVHREPIFFFTSAEQNQLALALDGFMDEDIAEELSISLSAVHKRWRGIFQKAERDDSEMPRSEGQVSEQGMVRGSEKRHRLLRYIRRHLEELRPVRRPAPVRSTWSVQLQSSPLSPPILPQNRGSLSEPTGLAFDSAGRLWVANGSADNVLVLDPQTGKVAGMITDGINGACRLAFGLTGSLYVANGGGHDITVYDGQTLRLERTIKCAEFKRPLGVAVGAYGEIYLANNAMNSVMVLQPDGGVALSLTVDNSGFVFEAPGCLAINGTTLYVGLGPGASQNAVIGYSISAFLTSDPFDLATFIQEGHAGPSGIAFDRVGNVYVSNRYSNSAVKFSATGEPLLDITEHTDCCEGIAVAKNGDIFIANPYFKNITVFNQEGKLVRTLG